MKTSIATVSISGDFAEKLAAIAKAGFDGIEIFEQDLIGVDMTPSMAGKMARDHGLDITLFQPFRDFEGLPEGSLRNRAFTRAARKFEVMKELGTDLVLICSSVHPKALGGISRLVDDFSELGDLAKEFDVRVGFEALAWGRHVFDHRDAWEIIRQTNHDNVGLILDSFHTLGRGIDTQSIAMIPGEKIFFVQLADAPLIEMDYLYWSRHFRNMPGEGDLDINTFMNAVCQTGYEGPLSLEIFNDSFRRGNPETVARDGYRSLIHLMDEVNASSHTAEIRLPPKQEPSTVTFIEFAVSQDDQAQFEALFSQLGFSAVGKHKSKEVKLYRQGNVNFLLNSAPSGYAAEIVETHGSCVSDIGLMTDNAEDVFSRAIALGAEPITQVSGHDETVIPSIKGCGAVTIRLLDKTMDIWKDDFDALPESTASSSASNMDIDHISQTMPFDEMLSWSLFYSTIFRMNKTDIVDVIDPDGIIKSLIMQSPNHSVSLILNGSDGPSTSANKFISATSGSSVQHVAIETSNIFEFADRLLASGINLLPQTQNYYRDLAARFDLDDTETKKLQSRNILYDEDENGCFYHLYTHALDNGFFFEFTQRAGPYKGFGAPNAPFRLSAQRRLNTDHHSSQS